MEGRDLLNKEREGRWAKLLEDIASTLEMVATLVDENGHILLLRGPYPEICERIRANEQTLTFVCGQTSTALMKQAQVNRSAAVDLCQIGLCKLVIPIFVGDKMVGAVTACGGILEGEDVDAFMVSQELGISEEEAEGLFKGCPEVTEQFVKEAAQRWQKRIEEIMQKQEG